MTITNRKVMIRGARNGWIVDEQSDAKAGEDLPMDQWVFATTNDLCAALPDILEPEKAKARLGQERIRREKAEQMRNSVTAAEPEQTKN